MTTLTASRPSEATAVTGPRYDRTTIGLHWATAILVVTLYALSQIWDFAPRGSALRHGMQDLHVSLGLLLAAVVLARIGWRHSLARRLPPAGQGLMDKAAQGMHHLLYLLLLAVIALGVSLRWGHHDPLSFFGLFTIPAAVDFTRAQTHLIGDLHFWVATTIIVLAGLHACAALLHHYVLRDGVLLRMLPGARRR